MRFEHPQLLWLLVLALPLLALFFWWAWRAKRRLLTEFVSPRLLDSLTGSVSTGRQKARLALIAAAVLLLLLVLARPQIGFSWDDAKSRGLDVVVAIDTSRSMLATDVAPNRLRRAQLAALDLKRLSRGDRFGLVAFAGSAFLQCPLTLDDEVYRQSVETLDVSIIPQGGTALAEAIQAARGAFKEDNDNHKVMVIFTDGEDHDGHALESARTAAADGLRIFTIGVGTPEGELLRVTDSQGRAEFLKDREGNAVKSRLDEDLLRQIAQSANGFYRRLSGASTMNVLYERGLAPLPKGELRSQRIKRYHERYQWVLGLVIVFLLAEMLLPERKQTKPLTAHSAARGAPVVAVFALLMLPTVALASASRALRDYQSGKYEKAREEYEQALKKRPEDPRLHFNAGAAAFQSKEYSQALEHWNSSLATQDQGLQQRAYYNIGNSQFRLGEDASDTDKRMKLWEQAMKSYQSAVKLNAQDGDAEFNLEYVKKKLEELKKQQQSQQQQQNKDEQKNQDKQQDQEQKQQQQKQDPSSKQDEQKQPEQEQKQQGKKPEDQSADQQKQKEPQQASKPDQKQGEENKAQSTSKQDEKPGDQADDAAPPQGASALKMTPEQAIRLLETFKAEERNMPFRPILKTNRHDRMFKDW